MGSGADVYHRPAAKGQRALRALDSAARNVLERAFTIAHLEAVTAVDGLDVEHVLGGEPKHALHRRGHVFMHAVGELDHDDRAASRGPHEATSYCSRSATELSKHDLHVHQSSKVLSGVHRL